MNFRTDLAMELHETHQTERLNGVVADDHSVGNLQINRIRIISEEGARLIGKPEGEYVTLTVPPFSDDITAADEEIEEMAKQIAGLVSQGEGPALVVGLGNQQITPDALGPKVIEGIIATRHIKGEVAKAAGLPGLRPVAAIAPGVLGQTGIETGEIIAAIAEDIKPSCVIAVDALASRSLDRLGCTIQISNSGISPGSGVANTRKELSLKTLGVPVVSIGVPTVVDATTLAGDLMHGRELMDEEQLRNRFEPRGAAMMVTPREIDLVIDRAAKVVSVAINRALQPELSLQDILMLSQ